MKKRIVFLALVLSPVVFTCFFFQAREVFGEEPIDRRRQVPPPLLEERPFLPPPTKVVPTVPSAPGIKKRQLPVKKVFIREIRVPGSTIFSDEELAEITKPYVNRELSTEDLEEIRRALTLHYVNKGYINSGAVIPYQEVAEGVITIQIIEGQLTQIKVEGRNRFRPGYIESRLALDADPPLNISRLQRRLQLLQQDPRIEQIHAELKPGLRRGESELAVRLQERTPYRLGTRFNNYEPPSVGANRAEAFIRHDNLTGNGDTFSLIFGGTKGISPDLYATYSLPFTPWDTTATLRYERTEYKAVDEPFESLDIKSKSEVFGVTLRHPFYRSLYQELALALTGESLRHESFLLGEPFSFFLGAENGKSKVTALRLAPEWIHRSQTQVFALRSRFSFGVDALDATISEDQEIPDGDFFCWLGQFQWAKRFETLNIETFFRLDLQLSDDPLLPIEQIAVGGRYTVRGYRENQMVRDNGLIASLECRIPLVRNRSWADYIQLVPFVDYGRAWNEGVSFDEQDYIASAGIGFRWAVTLKKPFKWQPQFEIYWGRRLKEVPNPRSDPQDNGIHAQVVIAIF